MRLFNQKMPKTYATPENAVKAVEKTGFAHLRYIIAVDTVGRFFPVFIGEKQLQTGVQFTFCVAN